jgi:hypothetical protein
VDVCVYHDVSTSPNQSHGRPCRVWRADVFPEPRPS